MRSDLIFCKGGFILYEKEINFHCNKINCTSWWQNFRDYRLLWLLPRMPHFYAIFGSVLIRGERTMEWETGDPTHSEKQYVLLPASCEISCPWVSRWDPRIWELKPRTPTVVSWTHHAVSCLHGCVHSIVSFWRTLPNPFPWLTHIIS